MKKRIYCIHVKTNKRLIEHLIDCYCPIDLSIRIKKQSNGRNRLKTAQILYEDLY